MDDSIFERTNSPETRCNDFACGEVVLFEDENRYGIVVDDARDVRGHTVYQVLVGSAKHYCVAVPGRDGVVKTFMNKSMASVIRNRRWRMTTPRV